MAYLKTIANIIPCKRTGQDLEIYSYVIPPILQTKIKIGSVVDIPFGKKNIRGIVVSLSEKSETTYQLKEVSNINEDLYFSKEYIEIIKWVSRNYLCSLGDAASIFLPPDIKSPRIKQQDFFSSGAIRSLTSEQQKVFSELAQISVQKNKKPALLHGVTGSGKTEVYIKLIEKTINDGKQVIFLFPEIMLATQIIERLNKSFPNKIAFISSSISASEKYVAYKDFFHGKKQIIVGPRSALLVPNTKVGLIIVDEEHEDAYKQESNPRYHAVDLAEQIAKRLDALLVLGSATPRIESFYKAKLGYYHFFELKNRYQKMFLPSTTLIDLKDELKKENYSPVSILLKEKIQKVLDQKKITLLLLNRLGMATFVSCRGCGEIINCPNCDIPLVYHTNEDKSGFLSCHHCDHQAKVPKHCPKCGGLKIKYFGSGIEKIKKEITALFPKARIAIADSKGLAKKGSYEKLNHDLHNGRIDILIGTQIIAKGLDIPAVDLVGVISADTGLHLPTFRANEKTFQLLTQVSGRSGRKESLGETIIQSYWPDSKPIVFASQHDYKSFFANEIMERKKYSYPPFCKLIRIIVEDKSAERAKKEIEKIAQDLSSVQIKYIGPAPCFFSRLNSRYRYHIIVKLDKLPNEKLIEIFNKNQYVTWDVNPTNLL